MNVCKSKDPYLGHTPAFFRPTNAYRSHRRYRGINGSATLHSNSAGGFVALSARTFLYRYGTLLNAYSPFSLQIARFERTVELLLTCLKKPGHGSYTRVMSLYSIARWAAWYLISFPATNFVPLK